MQKRVKRIYIIFRGCSRKSNHFVAAGQELAKLDRPTQNVVEQAVIASPSEIREAGKPCVGERLVKVSVPIFDNIKRNNILTFANQPELMKQRRP